MKGQKQINPQITQITQILMITLYERETRFLATSVGEAEIIKVPIREDLDQTGFRLQGELPELKADDADRTIPLTRVERQYLDRENHERTRKARKKTGIAAFGLPAIIPATKPIDLFAEQSFSEETRDAMLRR